MTVKELMVLLKDKDPDTLLVSYSYNEYYKEDNWDVICISEEEIGMEYVNGVLIRSKGGSIRAMVVE